MLLFFERKGTGFGCDLMNFVKSISRGSGSLGACKADEDFVVIVTNSDRLMMDEVI